MSVPPPPNQWGSQPPPGEQPVGAPQWGPPPAGPQGGPPQWGRQQPWGPPSGPPPRRGGKGKWILAGIAVLAVIAVTVVITALVVGKDSGSSPNPTPTNGNGSDFASANDKGPANIITEDPTCEAWGRVAREYSAQTKVVNWSGRDQSVPASAWSAEQRAMYETVGKAMTNAADQTVNLATLTPHRVMRELYGQFIAYAETFTERIPDYVASDDNLAVVADTAGSALSNICSAIDYRSAQPIAPLISQPDAPTQVSALGNSARPQRFLSTSDGICSDLHPLISKFSDDTAAWRALDAAIPATDWNPQQKATNDAVASVMAAYADDVEKLGRRSDNPVLQDFLVLGAQYQRAFVKAIPTYTAADGYLSEAAVYLVGTVRWACEAVRG
jgi:hypothetical protein